MWSYALKRAGATAVTLIAASVLVFAFIHLVPGDPIYVLLGDTATPDQVDALRHELGLDQPIIVQYFWWVGNALTGNLGQSIFFQAPVLSVIADGAETSILLATITMIWVVHHRRADRHDCRHAPGLDGSTRACPASPCSWRRCRPSGSAST